MTQKNIRIIPQLHIKGNNVVKPVQTDALRVVGNPQELAYRYYQEGADEILYMDIVASLYQRNLDFSLIKSVTQDIFIPVTVGGGIRTLQDIHNALHSGADKICINTYAIHEPLFIEKAVKEFGSQCIVLAIDAKKQQSGKWEAYTDGGREPSGKDVITWIKEALDLGAGEIYISSIDRDGTRKGYDLDLIKAITSFARVPVVGHGGAGDLESILAAVSEGQLDAVSSSSIFHFQDFTIVQVKEYLHENNINVRLV